MRKVTKTDVFTGLEIQAFEMNDGDLTVITPFHGNVVLEYDAIAKTYSFPAALLDHMRVMGLRETAEELGLSRMRVSRMCADGTLKAAKINGAMVIDAESVQERKRKMND